MLKFRASPRLVPAQKPSSAAVATVIRSSSRRRVSFVVSLSCVLLVVVFFAIVRFRLRAMPLERDEGEYAYAGQLMLEGLPPYSLAYNMKLPGIYAAYAAVMGMLGQTAAGIHLGLLVVNAATTLVLFFLVVEILGRFAASIAACSYALLSTSASVMGFEAHATNFVILPALFSVWLLFHAVRTERGWHFLLSGLLAGTAFLMKQHGMFFIFFGAIYLASERWGKDLRVLLQEEAEFLAGSVVPYLVTCGMMYRAGVFRQFWFWTVDYAGEYSKMGLRRAIRALLESSSEVIRPAWPIWILAGIGIAALYWNSEAKRYRRFLILLLVCSFLALCPGAYFRPHYYILFLPAVAILAGAGVSALGGKLGTGTHGRSRVLVSVLLFVACFGYSVFRQRQTYFELSPDEVVEKIYGDNAFVPALQIGEYLREHSRESARIAVLGSEPEIYFYAHRHSATGYLYMYSLIVHQKYTHLMRAQMMQELEANRPLYVVFVDVWDDWGGPQGGPEIAEFLPRLREFMNRSYELVGFADIGTKTTLEWGAAAQSHRPSSSKVIYVLQRKESDKAPKVLSSVE